MKISWGSNSKLKFSMKVAKNVDILMKSSLFDHVWYFKNYPEIRGERIDAVWHYLRSGVSERRNPHPLFDTGYYLDQNPDVEKGRINPLIHFILYGASEGRDPHPLFASAWYATKCPEGKSNPLLHYWEHGRFSGADPHPLFMSAFYRSQFPGLQELNSEPLAHYLSSGANTGLNPNPLFDTKWYGDTYPDVRSSGMNPLVHFRLIGNAEGRNPSVNFNTISYYNLNADVSLSNPLTALGHYLRYGALEGRKIQLLESCQKGESNENFVEKLSSAGSALSYLDWCQLHDPGEAVCTVQRRLSNGFLWKPTISIIVPVYKVTIDLISELISSIKRQTYPFWQLCFALAWSDGGLKSFLEAEKSSDERISLIVLPDNFGISGNSNEALKLAVGEYVGLLDHDDTLPPNALYEMVYELNQDQSIDFLYSDKDTVDESGLNRFNPLFKPQWSPELMLSINYLTHFNVMRASRLREIGGWDSNTDGAQDWDLFLRFIGKETNVKAVRHVLYHWRMIATSVASGLGAKPWAADAQLRAVTRYLHSNGWPDAHATFERENVLRVKWSEAFRPVALVLVIGKSETQIDQEWKIELGEIAKEKTLPLIYFDIREREFSKNVNETVANSTADFIVILDEHSSPKGAWLKELLGPLQNDDIAIVGGRLEKADGRLIEGGWVFSDRRPFPIFQGEARNYGGIFADAWCCRNHIAVSGSIIAIRKSAWLSAGGFSNDPSWHRYDLDLCVKISGMKCGRVMLNPFATATSNSDSVFGSGAIDSKLSSSLLDQYFPDGDPFFHPRLTVDSACHPTLRPIRVAPRSDFFAEARYCASQYDAASKDFERKEFGVAKESIRSVAWFVPDFDIPFYGGIHTILRAADFLQQNFAIDTTIVALGASGEDNIRCAIAKAFPSLAKNCHIKAIKTTDIDDDLISVDAAVATLWVTAYAIIKLKHVKHRYYFIQDYEPEFYPAGTTYSLAEATYKFGFYGICNTLPLKKLYEDLGGVATHFVPAVDTHVFNSINRFRKEESEPFLLFNYARPAHPRNCFEVIAEGLIEAKRRLKDRLLVVTAGADWDPRAHGLAGIVEHMGLLPYSKTGELYRAVDAGIVAMATSHPSYLPFELMACGALVLTNHNLHTKWLLNDNDNCLLFNLTRSSIADTIERAFENEIVARRLTEGGLRTITENHSDWTKPCKVIAAAILGGGADA